MNAQNLTPEQAEMRARLAEILPVGTTVYTVLRSAAPNGMSRRISVLIARPDDNGTPVVECIDWMIQRAGIAKRRGDKDGLFIQGAGMDMGFHLVYRLAHVIHPVNRETDPERSGGYSLTQRWL